MKQTPSNSFVRRMENIWHQWCKSFYRWQLTARWHFLYVILWHWYLLKKSWMIPHQRYNVSEDMHIIKVWQKFHACESIPFTISSPVTLHQYSICTKLIVTTLWRYDDKFAHIELVQLTITWFFLEINFCCCSLLVGMQVFFDSVM